VANAVDYIATLRQVANKASLPVGASRHDRRRHDRDRHCGSKQALGAEEVTIAYRRPESMNASRYEQEFARSVA
jgi:hypothetical protein